jgi:hypothetical protein
MERVWELVVRKISGEITWGEEEEIERFCKEDPILEKQIKNALFYWDEKRTFHATVPDSIWENIQRKIKALKEEKG